MLGGKYWSPVWGTDWREAKGGRESLGGDMGQPGERCWQLRLGHVREEMGRSGLTETDLKGKPTEY